ncbi:MAG: serine hydrolase [Gammaproteobacteria bacterium]|nr:serine hydrolase [Gammaproteobacteria bacterium]
MTLSTPEPIRKLRQRPQGTSLCNWRLRPHSSWSFQNVRELIPTVNVSAKKWLLTNPPSEYLPPTPITESGNDLIKWLEASESDSMVILKDGKKQWQWEAPHCDITKPHIIFSISKSITAILTGILADQKILNPEDTVYKYLPDTKGTAYEDCSIQHLLDMSVALDFTEDYMNPDGDYFRYRNATGWNPVDQTEEKQDLESFLYGLGKANFHHGEIFNYKSPNSDLLGLLIERASGIPYAELLSQLIWQPMGATSDGYVTVDSVGLSRGAGGVCVVANDLALIGQLILDNGFKGTQSIIPESWIADTMSQGNQSAWLKGGFIELLPKGNYRNQWYQVGDDHQCLVGLGIHGQWLLINPATSVVIVMLSSRTEPLNDQADVFTLKTLLELSSAF